MSPIKKIFAMTALSLCMSFAYADPASELQAKVQNYDNLISQINSQIVSEQNEIITIDNRIDTAKRLISGINPSIETSDNLKKLQQISERLISRKKELNDSVDENKVKVLDLSKAKQSFVDSQANLVTQSNYTSDIQSAINVKKAENDKLIAEKTKLESQIQDIETQIRAVKVKNDQLITQKKDYDSFIKQVDLDIKDSQKILDQKKQQSDDYRSLITEQDKQNTTLSQKIDAQKIEKQKKEQELSKVIEDEKINNQKLIAQKESVVKQNQQIVTEIENANKIYQANVAAKAQINSKIKSLESDLVVSKKKIKEINNQNIALFEEAKRSLVQNNQDIDSIDTSTVSTAINKGGQGSASDSKDTVKTSVIPTPPLVMNSGNEKNILVTKSLSEEDQFKKNGKTLNLYTVKRGDTLSLIVKDRYNTKSLSESRGIISDIEKLNSISSSEIINVGQELRMPNYNNL
jgi:chromosome segregation ATPase